MESKLQAQLNSLWLSKFFFMRDKLEYLISRNSSLYCAVGGSIFLVSMAEFDPSSLLYILN